MTVIKPTRALLSVSDKTSLIPFATALAEQGVQLLSTGGTKRALAEAGLEVADVSSVTKFPVMMDGRVKTLHPNIHGGILADRSKESHLQAMQEHGIEGIDIVVVNLYPFRETIAKTDDYDSCIENIDIGGPAMVRASAKNHAHVAIVTSPNQYDDVLEAVTSAGGTDLDLRKHLAYEAFAHTASYDAAISNWFAARQEIALPQSFTPSWQQKQTLRYGENPHQSAALYSDGSQVGVANATQLQGKELSYNNIADTDAAWNAVQAFEAPAVVIVKHANPCGVATADSVAAAYEKALASDPVSAYGGIIATNKALDADTANAIGSLFAEVIIAPEITAEARNILAKKKNLRLLEAQAGTQAAMLKTVSGGLLVQSADDQIFDEAALSIVTKRAPTDQEMQDLRFAFTVCKYVKSNAIVLAKDNATIGVGAGQMSRIDSSRIAAHKAEHTCTAVENATGAVLASDAFFPFADGLIAAAESGVTAVIQPGGSIRDEEVIAAADERNIAMLFTGMRHFAH